MKQLRMTRSLGPATARSFFHYLGAGRPVGDYLRQIVEVNGHTVALLVWGPACYALKDRDLWIAWSAPQRVERLKLIVHISSQRSVMFCRH